MSAPPPPRRGPDPSPEPPQPAALAAAPHAAVERRDALKLMGASLALASLAGCDETPEHGHPLHAPARAADAQAATAEYATVLELDGLSRGVIVRTRNGHAVKVEGNPRHPASLGATDIFAEAAVLGLHDPHRSRRIRRDGRPVPAAMLDEAMATARATLAEGRGRGLRILTGPVSSPTLARMLQAVLTAFPEARWHQHDPLADDAALEGAQRAFGRPVVPVPDLSRAGAVLCLGADPLGQAPGHLRFARDWITARAAGRPPRLIVAEATLSLTGARADRRIPLHPREAEPFARAVAARLGVAGLAVEVAHPAAAGVAAVLAEAPGAVVMAGRGQAPAVHALAHAMSARLGAAQRLLPHPLTRPEPMAPSLAALSADMAAGQVTHLLILGANPAYDAPASLEFAQALRALPFSLHLGFRLDETARLCAWHVPLPHPLESWGDSRAFDGTPAIRQPATVPLAEEARGEVELLSALLGTPVTAREAVRATWRASWREEGFEATWATALEEGVAGEPFPPLSPPLREGWDQPSPPLPAGLAAVFSPDQGIRGGAEAHDAWLQEMPRPLTKITWGNAALMAPATLAALRLEPGDEVELELGGRRVLAPCWPMPGHAPDCVTLPLGGGRRAGGPVGEGRGFDAYALRPADSAWVATGLSLRPTGRKTPPVTTDSHHRLDPIEAARSVPPGGVLPQPERDASLYRDWPYPGHAWGMAIDLDACIGCNACALACQAENNVPVVGPLAVSQGREMHWLRVDRYHHGPEDSPAVSFQPVPCMHCEQAPCEPVCPVNATLHDHEGLNVMVHARCIGTRTCSNNCPYKVRRFNWSDHRRFLDTPARNPEVSLRPRGVMEKCTYCTHRIAKARSQASTEGRALHDGEVETACQRACPTRAITFGDINDPGSAVTRAKRDGRHYALLGQLGTRPRTTYLARVATEEEG
ncbi:prokaryotic molybdopterin-containing oxidoreductase family, iron-sulfur binding subunit [Roseomonas rosea]|uniref:Prokaryotic molybdopterin-containing oxidoreductase family, iron-sulfur binding subunit n=1 Tax=Muricoccus roseus TaxID=198092 RepID=A0A1M6C981_9PROT|nr:4Fe-4S dicluster domain-containing protein [Roseomonas rosea]SHI57555.1 prokaryotic molybdopterin-containing oxidoreductase family, iron-sulfur binding subunit [Roseomonas rosea]